MGLGGSAELGRRFRFRFRGLVEIEIPGAYDTVATARVAGRDELAIGASGPRASCGAATGTLQNRVVWVDGEAIDTESMAPRRGLIKF